MYESISKNNELENEMTLDMSYFWYSDDVLLDNASDWACTNWQNQHKKSHLYTQYMCAMAFQMMQDILISLWCFSIGLMLEIRAIHPTWMFEFDFAKGTTFKI